MLIISLRGVLLRGILECYNALLFCLLTFKFLQDFLDYGMATILSTVAYVHKKKPFSNSQPGFLLGPNFSRYQEDIESFLYLLKRKKIETRNRAKVLQFVNFKQAG